MSSNDITLRSQQFAADQSARGNAYRQQGAEALSRDLPQIPMNYMRMRRMAMEETAARAEIANAELRNQDYQMKVQATSQLQALGAVKLQNEAMRLDVEAKRLQLEEAQKMAQGKVSATVAARGVLDEMGLLIPSAKTPGNVQAYDFASQTFIDRKGTTDELEGIKNRGRRGSQADDRRLLIDAEKALADLRKRQLGVTLTPEEQAQKAEQVKRLEDYIHKLRGDPKLSGEILDDESGQTAPPTHRQVYEGVPDPGFLWESLPNGARPAVEAKLVTAAQEYASKHNLPIGKAASYVTVHLYNSKKPENMAKVLVQSGLSREQAAITLKNALFLDIDKAFKVIDGVMQ